MDEDYMKVAREILEGWSADYARRHSVEPQEPHSAVMVCGNHLDTKVLELLRLEMSMKESHLPKIIIIDDTPRIKYESLKNNTLTLVKSRAEEIDLMLHGIAEQTDESYRKDFVEEQQKKTWLSQRMYKPDKRTGTRNRVK